MPECSDAGLWPLCDQAEVAATFPQICGTVPRPAGISECPNDYDQACLPPKNWPPSPPAAPLLSPPAMPPAPSPPSQAPSTLPKCLDPAKPLLLPNAKRNGWLCASCGQARLGCDRSCGSGGCTLTTTCEHVQCLCVVKLLYRAVLCAVILCCMVA